MSEDHEAQAQFLKTITLGAIAQASPEIQAYFKSAMLDLNALADEYLKQKDSESAISAFALAIPIFVQELGERVQGLIAKNKADSPKDEA